jgi:hypothetical protein
MITATSNFTTALAAFRNGQILLWIQIAGYFRSFTNYKSGIGGQYDWITSIDALATAIHDLDGGADQSTIFFNVLDFKGVLTSDFPGFVFEGKQITISVGLPGLAQADFTTVFTGYIDTVGSTNGNSEYVFNCSDISAKLSKVIYPLGDSGNPTDGNNPHTLNAHPLDILLDILNTQVGLAAGLIDATKIQGYRDGPFNGIQFSFRLTQSVAAADFIKQQLLKPLGGYLWVNSLGKITVNFFTPLTTPSPVYTLGPGAWTAIPDAEQVDMVNIVQFQFDKDDGTSNASSNYMAIDTEIYSPSTSLYGQFGEQIIPADGMRSGLQGFIIARMTARMIFGRYGLKNIKFDQGAADSIWQTCLLEPGDIVAVTHPDIPDRKAGVVGVTNKLFEIVDRKFNFTEGLMTFTMIDASFLSFIGNFLIAPNGTANYTGGSNTYMYMCSDTDQYSNADAGHILG